MCFLLRIHDFIGSEKQLGIGSFHCTQSPFCCFPLFRILFGQDVMVLFPRFTKYFIILAKKHNRINNFLYKSNFLFLMLSTRLVQGQSVCPKGGRGDCCEDNNRPSHPGLPKGTTGREPSIIRSVVSFGCVIPETTHCKRLAHLLAQEF